MSGTGLYRHVRSSREAKERRQVLSLQKQEHLPLLPQLPTQQQNIKGTISVWPWVSVSFRLLLCRVKTAIVKKEEAVNSLRKLHEVRAAKLLILVTIDAENKTKVRKTMIALIHGIQGRRWRLWHGRASPGLIRGRDIEGTGWLPSHSLQKNYEMLVAPTPPWKRLLRRDQSPIK